MINLSQKNVVKIAKETNFIKDNVEKVMRLADILELCLRLNGKINLFLKVERLSIFSTVNFQDFPLT